MHVNFSLEGNTGYLKIITFPVLSSLWAGCISLRSAFKEKIRPVKNHLFCKLNECPLLNLVQTALADCVTADYRSPSSVNPWKIHRVGVLSKGFG